MDVTQRDDRTNRLDFGTAPIEAIRQSVLLKLAVAGGLLIVLAAVLQVAVVNPESPGLVGIWTGMLPVWGTALLLIGLGSYAYIWAQRS